MTRLLSIRPSIGVLSLAVDEPAVKITVAEMSVAVAVLHTGPLFDDGALVVEL